MRIWRARFTGSAFAAALGLALAAFAPSANATMAQYNSTCGSGGCHSEPPSGPRLNAADNQAVIAQANTNHGMSGQVGNASIAAYIGTVLAALPQQTQAVGYNTTLSFPVDYIFIDNPGAVITTTTGGSPVNAATQGNVTTGFPGSINVQYQHTAGNCTSDTFAVRGTGAVQSTTNRLITMTITPPSIPVAINASDTIAYSTGAQSISVNPFVSGTTPTATMTIGTPSPNVGTLNATGAQTFTYTGSASAYAPTVTSTYHVTGPCSTNSTTRTVTISVNPPPAPTVASPATIIVPAASATPINLAAQITGIQDTTPAAGAGTYFLAASQPTVGGSGSTSVTGNVVTYTPPGGFTGITTFTYTRSGPGGTSNTGTVTLNVTAAPVVSDTTATTPFNTPVAVNLAGFIAGASTNVSVSGAPTNGTALVTGAAEITFTPTAGFFGTGTFSFIANGPGGGSPAPATVTVTINPPRPVVSNITGTVPYQTATVIDVASGISAVPITSVSAFGGVFGTVTGVVGTQVTFTPDAGYIGAASFQFNATNVAGTSLTNATANLTVTAPAAPTAGNLSVLVSATSPTPIDVSSAIGGFYNTIAVVFPAIRGATSVSGTVITYTPQPGFTGSETFTYAATGPGGTSTPGSITVTYTQLPVTPDRELIVPFNTITAIDLAAMIAGTYTSIQIATQPARGQVQVRGNVISYVPPPGYFGPDSFTYTATGAGGTSAPGTVRVTVNPPAPEVVSGSLTVSFNTPATIDLSTLVAGVATSYVVTVPPSNGQVVINGNIATYTPNPGYFGPDQFSFRAMNGAGTSGIGNVAITVGSLKPLAGAASLSVPLNSSGSKDLAPFIAGSGVQGVSIASEPAHGTVTVNGKVVTYTPKHNYFGPDSFTYVAFGNLGQSAPATVSVTVTGRPDPREDGTVKGLVQAQVDTARRFAQSQIRNFTRRMELTHTGPDRLMPQEAPVAEPAAPQKTTRAPEADEFAATAAAKPGPQAAAARNLASLQAQAQMRANAADPNAPRWGLPANGTNNQAEALSTLGAALGAATSLPGQIVSSIVSLATTQSVGVDSAAKLRDGTTVWMGGLANFGNIDGTDDRDKIRFSTDGLSLGFDKRFSDRLVLGMGVGYARDESRIGGDGSKSKAKGGSIAAYSSYQPSVNTFVDALIGFGRLDLDSDRYVSVTDVFASGTRKADQVFGSIGGGYEWRRDGMLVSPYGRLDFSADKLKGLTETGAQQYNLAYAGQTQKSTQVAFGVRAESQHETDFGRATPRIRAEYRRELQDARATSVSYADLFGGPEYSVLPSGVSRNAFLLGVGSDFTFRSGLKLGFDYQNERAAGTRNVQSIRLFASQELDGKGLPAFRWTNNLFEKPITVDFGYAFDDNVTRGRLDSERRSDAFYSMNASQSWPFALTERTRLVVTGSVGGDKFRVYDGLGRFSAGITGEYQFRPSAAFDAITWTLVGRANYDKYESNLRTGGRYFLGGNARRSFTDKIDVFAEAGANIRQGKSEVFQLKDYVGRLNIDYSLGQKGVLYGGGEYRKGDTFASGNASLFNIAIADVAAQDDAFDGGEFFAYRTDAKTWLGTVGWNYPLGPRDSLDFSYRRVQSTPTTRPNFEFPGALRYNDNLYSIVYLMRF